MSVQTGGGGGTYVFLRKHCSSFMINLHSCVADWGFKLVTLDLQLRCITEYTKFSYDLESGEDTCLHSSLQFRQVLIKQYQSSSSIILLRSSFIWVHILLHRHVCMNIKYGFAVIGQTGLTNSEDPDQMLWKLS